MVVLIRSALLLLLVGCSSAPEPKDWLYQQLGAETGVTKPG